MLFRLESRRCDTKIIYNTVYWNNTGLFEFCESNNLNYIYAEVCTQ